MAKPFDATTKDLLEADLVAWMAYLGLQPQGTVEVIDSDLSTVSNDRPTVLRSEIHEFARFEDSERFVELAPLGDEDSS